MIKKLLIMLSIITVSLSSQAIDKFYWNLDSSDYSWSNAANWADTGGTALVGVPTSSDIVKHVKRPEITIEVNGSAEANDIHLTHNLTAALSVVENGSLHIYRDLKMGTFGSGGGLLTIDGGEVVIDNTVAMSPSATGASSITLNSGSLIVSNNLFMGQNQNGSTAMNTLNISGGVADVGTLYVGRYSPGEVNISGGSLVMTNKNWDHLHIAYQSDGGGTVNLTGGSIVTKRIDINRQDGSGGALNILGGSVQVLDSYTAAIRVESNGVINVAGGQLEWKWDMLENITNLVNAGSITWTNGMTNMLTETWEASWTNGESILYADYDEVVPTYTTLWAYNTNPELPPPPPTGPTYYTNDTDGATSSSFVNTSGDGLYTTASNWDSGTVPTSIDTVTNRLGGEVNVLTIPSNVVVEAFSLDVVHNNTAKVSVVTGGQLNVADTVTLGNGGMTGVGLLSVDGGVVNIETNLNVGRWAGETQYRNGIVEINDGVLTVNNESMIGGWNANATGTVSMIGGIYSNNSYFRVGAGSADGNVNVSNALLVTQGTDNRILLGSGPGNAILNIYNGGEVHTSGISMDKNNQAGSAVINVFEGGTLKVNQSWFNAPTQGRIEFHDDDAVIHIDGGIFHWKWNQATNIQTLVEAGHITYSGGLTNMVSDEWDYAVTNQAGTSALYVKEYHIPQYTTAWSYDLASAPSGYDVFSATHNLVGGIADDDDGDQLSNLAEYALNSDPNDSGDTGKTSIQKEGSTFSVTYTKLADDDSVLYRLLDTTDLVFGSHGTNSYSSQDQGPVDGQYMTVTNNYEMDGHAVQFIKLEIESTN